MCKWPLSSYSTMATTNAFPQNYNIARGKQALLSSFLLKDLRASSFHTRKPKFAFLCSFKCNLWDSSHLMMKGNNLVVLFLMLAFFCWLFNLLTICNCKYDVFWFLCVLHNDQHIHYFKHDCFFVVRLLKGLSSGYLNIPVHCWNAGYLVCRRNKAVQPDSSPYYSTSGDSTRFHVSYC